METDYTRKTDAKEKKKIQNRIAQRVHRMLYPEIVIC